MKALVLVTSAKDRIFCSGANIYMLGSSSHAFKVNFCKFTNETRLGLEDLSAGSGVRSLAALNGTASGGGYELALACDEIVLADDGSSVVSLPEAPLLGVLPGTGGLTRLVDKRRIRRDLADVFCTTAEGVRAKRAVEWGLVDEGPPRARFERGGDAAARGARRAERPQPVPGGPAAAARRRRSRARRRVPPRLARGGPRRADGRRSSCARRRAPSPRRPRSSPRRARAPGRSRAFRELDDALLELRFNHPTVGVVAVRTEGAREAVLAVDGMLAAHREDGLVREVVLHMKRHPEAARPHREELLRARSSRARASPARSSSSRSRATAST